MPAEVAPGSVVVAFLDAGTWSACFGMSYRDMLLADMLSTQRIVREGGRELRALTGTGGIPASRNKAARDFLDNTDGEWLFFIDTDMGFAADTVERLVKSADAELRPVVGGLCFSLVRRRGSGAVFYGERYMLIPTVYDWYEDDEEKGFRPRKLYQRDTVTRCAGTGAACLLIHRGALERVRSHYGDAWFDPLAHPTAEKGGGPRTFSEDLSFCIRLQGLDIPVHVDTAVKTTHHKGAAFLDEDAYSDQLRAEEAEENARSER